MTRVQRCLAILLMTLALPALVVAQSYEMLTISGSVTGMTSTTCQLAPGQETGLWCQTLDEPIYFSLHSPTETPSATVGGYAPANTIIETPRASYFRAIRVVNDARAYCVCVPR